MDSSKLLNLLADDPRATISDLADILGESEEAVEKEKDELEKNNDSIETESRIFFFKQKLEELEGLKETS